MARRWRCVPLIATASLMAVVAAAPTGGTASGQSARLGSAPAMPARTRASDPTGQVHDLLQRLWQGDVDLLTNAQAAASQAQAAVAGATQALSDATAAVNAADEAVRQADQHVLDSENAVEVARQQLAKARRVLVLLAVGQYVNASGGGDLYVATSELNRPQTRIVLGQVTFQHQRHVVRQSVQRRDQRIKQLADARVAAQQRRNDAAAARSVRDEKQRALTSAQETLSQTNQTVAERTGRAATATLALADLARPGWQFTIEGPSVFTPEELGDYASDEMNGARTTAPINKVAQWFVTEGADEDIRGDMAFAQAILETGYFRNADTVRENNFAGVGHCDTCPSGFHFSSAQLGVRGQIQLLKSFADAHPSYHHPLARADLKSGKPGCCPTWDSLTGVWATAKDYGPKILDRYVTLLEWLVERRRGH